MLYCGVKDFYGNVAKRRLYWLPCLFFMALSYGFSVFSRTVGIDDFAREQYVGSGSDMLAGMRWGISLYTRLFSSLQFAPFHDKFLGLVFMFIALIIINAVFYEANGRKKNIFQYTVFSCLFITYPLINEIWEYSGANAINAFNLILVSTALLLQMDHEKNGIKISAAAGIILAPVMSGYEAGIFSYISLAVMMLYVKYREEGGRWFSEGISYSVPLFVALILRVIIGFALIKFYGLKFEANGATGILWLKDARMALVYLTGGNFIKFIQRGLVYFPITVFLFTAAVFFVYSVASAFRRKRPYTVILGFLVLFSLFLLPIVQGAVLQYRAAQSVQLFIGFTGFLIADEFSGRIGCLKVIFALLMFLCLRQGIYLNRVLALNSLRSDNEAAVVRYIGMRLYSEFDTSKKIVFVCSSYDLGEWINGQVSAGLFDFREWFASGVSSVKRTKYIDTNVNPVFPWASLAFDSQKQLGLLFSYCGYDLNVSSEFDSALMEKYRRIAAENSMKPFEIRDMGEYILVNLDNTDRH